MFQGISSLKIFLLTLFPCANVISGFFQHIYSSTVSQGVQPRMVNSDYLKQTYPATVLGDARLDAAGLLAKYQYPVETHFITTEDKYILRAHRIPRPGARPVLLLHGLLDTSATWLLMGPWSGLGYYLYDNGYDVWMGNARGNRYSRNHTTLNPNKNEKFWKFSFHEIGYYDLPAMIDYILTKSGHKKLTYFGHSQGTAAFFIMASLRPAYNNKINLMHAISPVVYARNAASPYLVVVRELFKLLANSEYLEVFPLRNNIYNHCSVSKSNEENCLQILYEIFGHEVKEFNRTMSPVVLAHFPAGSSFFQPLHYMQIIESDRFQLFDHGVRINRKLYGSARPPNYPLESVSAPVVLHYTHNDYLANVTDVQRLAKRLPNLVKHILYPYNAWNHITLIWGINARRLVHRDMLDLMQFYK